MKLREYIEKQEQFSDFTGLLERYFLAKDLLYTFKNTFCDENGTIIESSVPHFDIDDIEMIELLQEDASLSKRYKVIFPEAQPIPQTKNPFSNRVIADCCKYIKSFIGELNDGVKGKNTFLYKNKEEYIVSTLATILFYIYFGYHPLCGRDYYENANISSDAAKEFFEKKPRFIFDLNDNTNRFVNGYHSQAWALWKVLSEGQRSFWENTFSGAINTYNSFYGSWKKVYDNFTESTVQAPCGEKLPTIVFDENYALITSDNNIGNNPIRCKYCYNRLEKQCDSCQAVKIASLLTLKIKAVSDQADGDSNTFEDKEICLYSGKTLYTTDFVPSEAPKKLFDVITSKKGDLLGLKYASNVPIEANQEKVTRFYKKGEVIALLPGIQIYVIPDVCKIVVPRKSNTVAESGSNSGTQVTAPLNGVTDNNSTPPATVKTDVSNTSDNT